MFDSLRQRFEAAKQQRAAKRRYKEDQAILRRRIRRQVSSHSSQSLHQTDANSQQDVVDAWKVGKEERPWHKFWRDVRFFGREERRKQYEAYKRSTFPVERYAFREPIFEGEE